MAVLAVPRELRERLGDAATDSLVDLLQQCGAEQREDLIAVVEERVALRVAESRDALRSEMRASLYALRSEMHASLDALRSDMHDGFMDVQKQLLAQQQQIGIFRADLGKEIGDVRKEITVQTRWLLTVLVAATILIPVMQRVLQALFP